jgi:hypothetical protein
MNELIYIIGIFTALQLVNVILNTLKTLIMAKKDSVHASAVINAVTFGFYTAIVKQIAGLPLEITITVTIITNIIGVYITYWIMKKVKKDSLWKIEIYAPINTEGRALLENCGVMKKIEHDFVTMYCYTQTDSMAVSEIIKAHELRHNIVEIYRKF